MGPERPRAAAAGHDLVGDEKNAVPLRYLDDLLQGRRAVHAHAAGSLHERLEDHCCRLRGMFAQVSIKPIRVQGQDIGLTQQRLESTKEQRVTTHRHCPERITVITVFEAEKARSTWFP